MLECANLAEALAYLAKGPFVGRMVTTRVKHDSCGKGNLLSTGTPGRGDFALVNLYAYIALYM